MWRPKNIFDWLIIINVPVNAAFIITLAAQGHKSQATMQFFLAAAIIIICSQISKKQEERKASKEKIQQIIDGGENHD